MNNANNEKFVNTLKNLLHQQIDRSDKSLQNTCVVFDIDATLIIPSNNKIIKPVYDFYKYCESISIPIFIITARPGFPQNINHTVNMLRKLGINTPFYNFMNPKLYYQKENGIIKEYMNVHKKQREYKETARKNLLQNYDILMSLGDMQFDVDTYCNIGVLVQYHNDNSINYIIGQNQ